MHFEIDSIVPIDIWLDFLGDDYYKVAYPGAFLGSHSFPRTTILNDFLSCHVNYTGVLVTYSSCK